jgi:hypothetical protein
MAAFSGMQQSPNSSLSGNAHGIAVVHRCGHQNGQSFWYILLLLFHLLLP